MDPLYWRGRDQSQDQGKPVAPQLPVEALTSKVRSKISIGLFNRSLTRWRTVAPPCPQRLCLCCLDPQDSEPPPASVCAPDLSDAPVGRRGRERSPCQETVAQRRCSRGAGGEGPDHLGGVTRLHGPLGGADRWRGQASQSQRA